MKNRFLKSSLEGFFYCLAIYLIFFDLLNFRQQYLDMNVHPLLLVVALMAMKYGTYLSIPTALFAFFFYILGYYKLGGDPVVFFFVFNNYKFLLMFLFAVIIFGRFRDRSNERIEQLVKERETALEEMRIATEKNQELFHLNEELKDRVITGKESIILLNKIISSLFNKNLEEIYTEVVRIAVQFLHGEVVSLYSYNRESNTMKAEIKVGKSKLPDTIKLEGDFKDFIKVLENKEPLESHGKLLEYVAPILFKNEVIGILNIEKIDAHKKGSYSFQMFKILFQWMNMAISSLSDSKIESKDRILKLPQLERYIEEEERRKEILNTKFAVYEGKVSDLKSRPEEIQFDKGIIGLDDKVVKILFRNHDKQDKKTILELLQMEFSGVDFYEV